MRLFASLVLSCCLGALLPGTVAANEVRVTPVGVPLWAPVDLHLFSAPIGTAPDYAAFAATQAAILPPPNHLPHPQLGIGPGRPHLPPYTGEIAAGVRRYDEHGPFRLSQFSNGNGVWLAWMNVPILSGFGSSPDFAFGPIIANRLFPITVRATASHRGVEYAVTDFTVPKLDDALDPPFAVDGHSHFPAFLADGADFVPSDPVGAYDWAVTIIDHVGNGWRIRVHFAVRP